MPDGRLQFVYDGETQQVNLENIERQYLRDKDEQAVRNFVAAILNPRRLNLPWKIAREGIRYQASPAGIENELEGLVFEPVSRCMVKTFVYIDADERLISFVTEARLKEWKVNKSDLQAAANKNMDELIAATTLEVDQTKDGARLGMLSINSISKGSLIFSPSLRSFVREKLGWPILAVVPCRDFIYLFSDESLINRLGTTVRREYKESGYPVTPEILKISDIGVEALGAYFEPN